MVDRTEAAAPNELAEPVEGKGEIRIGLDAAVVEGTATVALGERRQLHVGGKDPVARVAAPPGNVERFLVVRDEPRRRDEGDAALGKRPPKRAPRDGIDAAPRVASQEQSRRERELA